MRTRVFSLLLWVWLLPQFSYAQQPVLQSTTPARHSLNGPRNGPVRLTFSQPVATPAAIQINTNQLRGRRAGTFSGSGTNQISFQPSQPFAPGERVSVTVPAGTGAPAQVVEFRAAAGRGTAQFSTPVTIGPPPTNQPAMVVAGDIDNDGDVDLIAGQSNGATICLNDGTGQFTAAATPISIAPATRELELADVNGDGNLDLISSALYAPGVYLNLGDGQGTFQGRTTLFQPSFTSQFVTGDFNADGLTDVLLSDPSGTSMVLRLFAGVSTGTLVETRSSPAALFGRDMGVADMDEDGDLDVLVVTDTTLGLYLNNGTGQFTAGPTVAVNSFSGEITVGDFTGDGHADVICSSYQTANLSLVPGTGAGGWQPLQNVAVISRTWHVRSADMDGDADLDLLVTNDRGITQVMLNNGTGQFAAATSILLGWEQFTLADAADLNGDGVLDIYTGHQTSNPSNPHGIDIFFNQPLITKAATASAPLRFDVFPNPAHDQLTLHMPPDVHPIAIEIRDVLGRLVRTQLPEPVTPTKSAYHVSVTGLAPGRYAVFAQTRTGRAVRWVVVD